MGYRVGQQCIESKEAAFDYLLSAVSPVITPDGAILKPEKIGNSWFLNGNEIALSLPECSFVGQIQDGALFAAPFLMLFAIMFSFKIVAALINGSRISDGS